MRKRKSIYQFLIALLVFSLLIPAGMVGASTAPTPDNGSLTIHKFEREPGVEDGEDGDGSAGQGERVPEDAKALEGVEFTITQTHSYDPATDKWTEVTGGETHAKVTDSDGLAEFHDLPLGRYTVEETKWPNHVNPNTETVIVDIPMTSPDGETVNYDVHIYPKNETIRGAVKLKKMDGKTKVALGGVGFELYHKNGQQVEGTGIFTTNESGYIYVSGLAYGKYYFKEIETLEGYVLGDQRIEFSITKSGSIDEAGVKTGGKVVKVKAFNFAEPEVEKSVDKTSVNRGEKVTYTLTVNLPGDIGSYEKFVITDLLDDNLQFDPESEVISVDGAFTASHNNQSLTWTVTDFSKLVGVETVTIIFDAFISEDAVPNIGIDNIATFDFENQHGYGGEKNTDPVTVTPTAGNVTVIKIDGDTEASLSGAEFELRKSDGKVYKGTTDDYGEIIFENVDFGEYLLVETKAPNGYNKLRNPIEVIVNDEKKNETYTIENFKSGWHLPKTGGMGTIPFTIIGLLIMGSAIYLYVRRRNQIA